MMVINNKDITNLFHGAKYLILKNGQTWEAWKTPATELDLYFRNPYLTASTKGYLKLKIEGSNDY